VSKKHVSTISLPQGIFIRISSSCRLQSQYQASKISGNRKRKIARKPRDSIETLKCCKQFQSAQKPRAPVSAVFLLHNSTHPCNLDIPDLQQISILEAACSLHSFPALNKPNVNRKRSKDNAQFQPVALCLKTFSLANGIRPSITFPNHCLCDGWIRFSISSKGTLARLPASSQLYVR